MTLDPWVGRMRESARLRGDEVAFVLDGLLDAPDGCRVALQAHESPIEAWMAIALATVAIVRCGSVDLERTQIGGRSGRVPEIRIGLQMPIGRYRADLVVMRWDGTRLVVECDGAEFHGTAEAKARDAQRDRDLLDLGFPTVRYPGASLWADPIGCAIDALDTLDDLHWRQRREGRR